MPSVSVPVPYRDGLSRVQHPILLDLSPLYFNMGDGRADMRESCAESGAHPSWLIACCCLCIDITCLCVVLLTESVVYECHGSYIINTNQGSKPSENWASKKIYRGQARKHTNT